MFKSRASAKVGDAAPPFCLPSSGGLAVSLVDLRGRKRVVLAFYPEDDTPGCSLELRGFETNRRRFEALDTQVMGVSHNQVASQAKFACKLDLKFPLLADPPGDIARMYGAKKLLPFFLRKTFVIDGRGVVRLIQDGQPDIEQLLVFLAGLSGDLSPSHHGDTEATP